MDRAWRPLPIAPHSAVPPLLVAATFGPASYSVAVTDLARVWSESLDRRGICLRALQENTTIDPSYDSEQMAVFLGKIRAVFDRPSAATAAAAGDDACSLSLASSADDGLLLHITCALPGGLPPLKWPLHLALASTASSSSLSSSLVKPLLQDRARSQRRTAALVAALRQKDAVIAKLVDKLEAMGAGAESAFPSLMPSGGGGGGGGAGARRAGPRLTRADVERRIKGLAPFDEAAFDKQVAEPPSDDISALLATFGELPCSEDDVSVDSDWWQSLGKGKGVALTRTTGGAGDSQRTPQGDGRPAAAAALADDDGFQSTPGRDRRTVTAPSAQSDPPSPTPAPARKQHQHQSSASPQKPKGLGKIGGRLGAIGKKTTPAKPAEDERPASPPPLPSPPPPPPPPPPADLDEDDTASENDEPTKKKEKAPPPPSPEAAQDDSRETVAAVRPKSARGGLGRIGGKKEPAPSVPATAPPEPPAAASKSGTEDEPKADAGKRKADAKESPAPQPVIEDAKRAEILQQAVAKNAAPVRKKRKF